MAYHYAEDYVEVDLYSRQQYLAILDMLKKDTESVVIVQIDGPNDADPIVETARNRMQLKSEETVSEWLGTIAPGRGAAQYTFESSAEFFGYLATLESFFLWKNPAKPHMGYMQLHRTDFGIDDIAFLDRNDTLLFYTTTHEGFAWMRADYDAPLLHFPE